MAARIPARREIHDLPGPRGLPLLGNLHRIGLHDAHLVLEQWCERYGPLYTFRAGPRRFVVVADREAANAILRERPEGFRRPREVESVFREVRFHGVFSSEGEDWRRQRRIAVTALNSNRLHSHFHIVYTACERLHRRLRAAALEGRPIEIQRELTSYTVDIATALAFGVDVNTLERGEDELQRNIQFAFEMLGRRVLLPIPYWHWIQLPADRRLKRALAALEVAVKDFIDQARRQLDRHPERREEPTNFLEAMLAAQSSDGSFDDEEIFGNTMTLLFAGEDTTAHSMAWALWYLAREPEVQERWAQEAAEVLGEEPVPPDHETVGRLHYGDAVLRESMRLKAVAPALMHEPLADVEIAGVRIPAQTRIVIPTRHIGREAGGPEFDPALWLEGDRAPDQRSFLAFGAGPRFCPGRNLAFLEAKSAMATIARGFELELDPRAREVRERLAFMVIPEGLRIKLRQRAPGGPPSPSPTTATKEKEEIRDG